MTVRHNVRSALLTIALVVVAGWTSGVGRQQIQGPEQSPRTGAGASLDAADRWDVTKARGETREIDFSTSEGTWMSVDLSPDGRWIVFDLLAHIYRLPAEGG